MSSKIRITLQGKERTIFADSVLGQLWKIWTGTGKRDMEIYHVLSRIAKRWKYGKVGKKPGSFVVNVSTVVNKLAMARLPSKGSNDFNGYRSYYMWILDLVLYERLDYAKFIHHESPPNIFNFKILTDTRIEDKVVDLNYKRPETNPEEFRLGLISKDDDFEPDERSFIDRYWEVARSNLMNVQNTLFIYEYIEKGSSAYHPDYLLAYSQAHNKVFELIEKRLSANKRLVYKRLFALSSKDSSLDKKEQHKKEQLVQFVAKCTVACFSHLLRCLTGSNKLRFTQNRSASGFFLVQVSRHYHFALVDDKIILSEYYRYDKQGDCVPDILMGHNSMGEYKTLEHVYGIEFDRVEEDMRISSIKDIVDAMQEISYTTEKELNEINPEQDAMYGELKNKKHSLDIKKQLLDQVMEKLSKKP